MFAGFIRTDKEWLQGSLGLIRNVWRLMIRIV